MVDNRRIRGQSAGDFNSLIFAICLLPITGLEQAYTEFSVVPIAGAQRTAAHALGAIGAVNPGAGDPDQHQQLSPWRRRGAVPHKELAQREDHRV
jgi:hypothetical protein